MKWFVLSMGSSHMSYRLSEVEIVVELMVSFRTVFVSLT